jgi:hypothetical protein
VAVCSKTEANNYLPASIILSTLASLIPLICKRSFLGEYATDSTVQKPASLSFSHQVQLFQMPTEQILQESSDGSAQHLSFFFLEQEKSPNSH